MQTPNIPTIVNVLQDVSASSKDDIWAVGYTRSVEQGAKTLAMHWDGKEWKIVPTPNPGEGDNFLDGVVTLGPNDAWAVGDSGTAFDPGSILLHWDGKAWISVEVPELLKEYSSLYSITALSPTNIWAAGVTGNYNAAAGVIVRYDGVNWGVHKTVSIPDGSSILYEIAARAPNDIWAVGAHQIPGGVADVQVHWNGTDWEYMHEQGNKDLRLREAWDVALAPNGSGRWVVGTFQARAGILHFDGPVKERTGRDLRDELYLTTYLRGVVASSSTEAWAVGFSERKEGKRKNNEIIVHTTDGSNWVEVKGVPIEGEVMLNDIIAIPGTSGEYMTVGTANGATLIEVYRDPCAPPPATPTPTAAAIATAVLPTPSPIPTFAPTPIPNQSGSSRVFAETGKTVSGVFLDYWNKNGGLAQQGYPISEMFTEVSVQNGRPYTVQYFERAVFEYHPENQAPHDVLLSQLGTFQYKKKYPGGAPGQQPNNAAGSVLFQETGKRVGGRFLEYWQKNGGLAQQGYPISEEFVEKSELNGKEYRVQYFERAVFEYHPENQPPYDVLLSQVGTFQHKQRYGGK